MRAHLLLYLITAVFTVSAAASYANESPKPLKWAVNFGPNLPPSAYNPYSLIILESDNHPDIAKLLESGKTVLAYLSIGEIASSRPYFSKLQAQGLLLQENQNWPGSYMVDLRNKEWTKKIITDLIPSLLFQHFNGVFLDTADNAEYLESKDPKANQGMQEAAVRLIKAIRLNYPDMIIVMNRGFALLPKVADSINMVVAESILSDHSVNSGTKKLVPEKEYQESVFQLQNAKKINPNLKVLTLDYWDPEDKEGIKKIYVTQRKNGFQPYVSTADLEKVIPEPE